MNPDYNKIILENKPYKEPMSDKRLQMILTFAQILIAEFLGFSLAFVFILAMAGVFRR